MNVLERSAPQLPENARSAKNPCEGTAMDLADLISLEYTAIRVAHVREVRVSNFGVTP
jgi:hypothetical protein